MPTYNATVVYLGLLDKFAHDRDAFLWLFQLHKVRRLRQEIVIYGQNVTKVERRQIGIRQGRISAEDLYWATKCFKIHQNSKSASVIYELRFVFTRTPQLIPLLASTFAQRRLRHQIANPGHGTLEDW